MSLPINDNPQLFNLVENELNAALELNISWLTKAYPTAYRYIEDTSGGSVTYPAIRIIGNNTNQYLKLFPDNELGNFSFINYPSSEDIGGIGRGVYETKRDIEIIFWWDYSSIYPVDFNIRDIENVKYELLDFFNRYRFKSFKIRITGTETDVDQVYSGYDSNVIDDQYNMRPYGMIKIIGEVSYLNDALCSGGPYTPLVLIPVGGLNADWEETDTTKRSYILNKPVGLGGSELEKLTEGGNTGWRILGRSPLLFGDIGGEAVDLSQSFTTSSVLGATGNWSFAANVDNEASGTMASALGYQNTASGDFSFSWGTGNNATVNGSTAWGTQAAALGEYSTAFGYNVDAYGYASTVLGINANSVPSQTIDSWVATDELFKIGNGESNILRSDAFLITKDGTITAPSFDIGQITDNKALITKEYFDANAGGVEVNDLTAAVVWANVPDVNITQTSVTQHESALTITESQISDLGNYILDPNNTLDLATDQKFKVDGDIEFNNIDQKLYFATTLYMHTKNSVENIYLGPSAGLGAGNTGTIRNVGIGKNALLNNTNSYSTAVGSSALAANVGNFNTGLGYGAGTSASGANNTLIGGNSGYSNTGSSVVAIGYDAGRNNLGSFVVAIGGEAAHENSDNYLVAIGHFAGRNSTGQDNSFVGYSAGSSFSGSDSEGFGAYALRYSQGVDLIGVGHSALETAKGNDNIGVGRYTGQNIQGDNNTGFGRASLRHLTGSNNTGLGYRAIVRNGSNNTLIGSDSGSDSLSGTTYNVTSADAGTDYLTVTSHGITVGDRIAAKVNSSTISGMAAGNTFTFEAIDANTLEILLVNITTSGTAELETYKLINNSSTIGYNAKFDDSNQIQLGNSSVTQLRTYGALELQGAGYSTDGSTVNNATLFKGTDNNIYWKDGSGVVKIINETTVKNIHLEDPTASEDIGLMFTDRAIEITELKAVLPDGASTPSVTYTIRFSTNRSAVGTEVVTGGSTVTSTGTGDTVTTFNDATIAAGNYIWLETTAQSGTVPKLELFIDYK